MTQQIFTRCKCGGELVAFGTRCLQCGPLFPLVVGIDPAGGADATVVVQRADDFSDKFFFAGSQWTPQEIQAIETAREIRAEIDKVCGLPPFGKIEQKIDLRPEALRHLAEAIKRDAVGVFTPGLLNVPRVERFSVSDFGRYVVDSKTGRKYIAIELYDRIRKLADDVARDASRPGLSRELRERAERAAGRVTAVNFTRAAPDEAIVTHLCEIVERLAGTDVAQLDQENARLRRELAAMKGSRDGWQDQARVWVSTASELRRRLDPSEDSGANVTRIEPFPDVEPYAGDWIPPSHKPRMLP